MVHVYRHQLALPLSGGRTLEVQVEYNYYSEAPPYVGVTIKWDGWEKGQAVGLQEAPAGVTRITVEPLGQAFDNALAGSVVHPAIIDDRVAIKRGLLEHFIEN